MITQQHTFPDPAFPENTGPLIYRPPANHWLRIILAAVRNIICLLTCTAGEQDINEEDIPEGETIELLPANALSAATSITNTGGRDLLILEAGRVVALVRVGKTAELGLPGLYAISATIWAGDINEGQEASAQAVRRLRCTCGEAPVVYDTEPVGAYLL